jgi:hypothetical protein
LQIHFCINTSFGTPSGARSNQYVQSEIDVGNIIAVSEEDLKEEQKQAMKKAIEEYKQLCLKSFSLNKSGQVIQKQDLSLPRQITFDSNPGKLQEMVNSAVNHALINHSNVLSNTVHNVVVRTFKEGQASPHYVGPAYHQSELASVITPSAPLAVAGTEVSSPPVSAGLSNVQSTPMRLDSGRLIQIYQHRLYQVLCHRVTRLLLIGGDTVCLQSHLLLTLGYLNCLTQ